MISALDRKHIRIRCAAQGGSQFYNYNEYHSIVLRALVDANYRFMWAQVGALGAASYAQLWNESALRDAVMEENERVFNYRLSRARRCMENAFGKLANR